LTGQWDDPPCTNQRVKLLGDIGRASVIFAAGDEITKTAPTGVDDDNTDGDANM